MKRSMFTEEQVAYALRQSESGTGGETIRCDERSGLAKPPTKSNGSGFRVYPEDTMQRIRFIRQAQQVGFSRRETEKLLSLRM